jgi:hypothetical protein
VWRTLNAEYIVFAQGAAGDGMLRMVGGTVQYLRGRLPEGDMTPLKGLKVEVQVTGWLEHVWLSRIGGGNT